MLALLAAAALALRVVDGDTFVLGTEKIRIEGVDAPETRGASCAAERALGALAANRLETLLAAGDLTLVRTGKDRYARTLARVSAGGVDVGAALIAEGYARAWKRGRKRWCALY